MPRVTDLRLSFSKVWIIGANTPLWKRIHESDSPKVRVHVFLLNQCYIRPLGSPAWCYSPAVGTFGSCPWAMSSPQFPICSQTKVTDGCAASCGSPVAEVWRIWRLLSGLSLLFKCHYWHTEVSLKLEPLFSSTTCSVMGFNRGPKCARSTAINPVYCVFLWRAVYWQTLPLIIIEQTSLLLVRTDIVCWLSKNLQADFRTVDALFFPFARYLFLDNV